MIPLMFVVCAKEGEDVSKKKIITHDLEKVVNNEGLHK
jgi:hypothetical protein